MTDWTDADLLLVINIMLMQNAEQDALVQAVGDILKMLINVGEMTTSSSSSTHYRNSAAAEGEARRGLPRNFLDNGE